MARQHKRVGLQATSPAIKRGLTLRQQIVGAQKLRKQYPSSFKSDKEALRHLQRAELARQAGGAHGPNIPKRRPKPKGRKK